MNAMYIIGMIWKFDIRATWWAEIETTSRELIRAKCLAEIRWQSRIRIWQRGRRITTTGSFRRECMGTSIIDKPSEKKTVGILRRRYVLAHSPINGLDISTHRASIRKEPTKMLQPLVDDNPPMMVWSHAQKNPCYEKAFKRGRWYER